MDSQGADMFTLSSLLQAADTGSAANQKTPISVLQELCARSCLTPEYKLLSVEGAVHAPTFMYRVQVGDAVANATGQSKKKAKHAAARALLEKLLADDGPFSKFRASVLEGLPAMDAADPVKGSPDASKNVASTEEDGIPGNPVGELQERCMKERWRPPYYETVAEEGLPHERTFAISCLVNNFNEIGMGKSKRLAKRQAAHKMIQLLDTIHNGELNGDDQPEKVGNDTSLAGGGGLLREAKCYMGLKEQNINTLTPRHSQQVQQPLTTAGMDYVGLLKEISEEQTFEVTYVPLEELSTEGKHCCLVQLTAMPLAVCLGEGPNPERAKQYAARAALEYLKIMTKK
ncbi:RISC-loading complex subunit TARBP2-like isoform X2 [Ornithodoros turicata]|uniref:RISC-loading complex subunit TARBP2-like isoform X2 n=1 Tax=Ornithodoros turicata TaxID=34597 RepID=UPI003139417B